MRRRDRRVLGLGWLALLAVMAGCGSGSGQETPQGGGAGGGPNPGEREIAVEVAPAELGRAARVVTISGTVEPIRSIGVNSLMAGAVLSVSAEEGDLVRQGQVLARLDDREVTAQLGSAEANLALTKSSFERAEKLVEGQIITRAEFERERAAYEAARAQVQQLRARNSYATIRSPLTGVVTEKRIEGGDIVGTQTRLFSIADVSTMVVRVPVSELDVASVFPKQSVRVTLDALPGDSFPAQIRRIFPTADTLTRLVPVEVALGPEAKRLARPGYLARVTIPLEVRDSALLVPANAVVTTPGEDIVFVVDSGQASRRAVTRGLTFQGRVEIRTGLRAGERVVVAGNNALRDGATVRVVGKRVAADSAAAARRGAS